MRQRDFATVELKEEDSLPLPLSPPPSFLSFSPVIASFSYQRWGRGGKTARNMSERLVNAERNVAKMQNYCMLHTNSTELCGYDRGFRGLSWKCNNLCNSGEPASREDVGNILLLEKHVFVCGEAQTMEQSMLLLLLFFFFFLLGGLLWFSIFSRY